MRLLRRRQDLVLVVGIVLSFAFVLDEVILRNHYIWQSVFRAQVDLGNPDLAIADAKCDKNAINLLGEAHNCMITRLREVTANAWNALPAITQLCNGGLMDNAKLKLLPLDTMKDPRFRLEYKFQAYGLTCNHITMGIGRDIGAELHMRRMYPNCTFCGADSSYRNGKHFKRLGKYMRLTLSDDTAADEPDNPSMAAGTVVSTTSFEDFFEECGIKDRVDSLFVDIAGYEYKLFRHLQRKTILAQLFNICMLTLELHLEKFDPGTQPITSGGLLLEFLQNSPFVLTSTFEKQENRFSVFLVNYQSRECQQRFLMNC